jgi:hypothetical protein
MKTFAKYHYDTPDTLDEGFLRGTSALVLMTRIYTKRKQIQRTKKLDAKSVDALASMILASASLTFAMSQLPPESLKGKK